MKHQETCPHKGSIHPTRQSRSYHFLKALKTFAGGSVGRNQFFLSGNLPDGTRDVKTSVSSEAGQHRNCPKKRFVYYIFETVPWPLLRCDWIQKPIIFLEDDLFGVFGVKFSWSRNLMKSYPVLRGNLSDRNLSKCHNIKFIYDHDQPPKSEDKYFTIHLLKDVGVIRHGSSTITKQGALDHCEIDGSAWWLSPCTLLNDIKCTIPNNLVNHQP